ncbi:hypothetical protein KNP414_04170 [Paenibacillus mucilaginosus KNP414]|uniref:Uncharacterized protein n=1 Tax=Paenibacillus mucilaginosus (strain KNP414) TaxID=1036673 RepID=F8FFS5_PAEMK|nr:hypothetical protein KNP414_04170 [Paenibacillus mucilaginosus KNP414]
MNLTSKKLIRFLLFFTQFIKQASAGRKNFLQRPSYVMFFAV